MSRYLLSLGVLWLLGSAAFAGAGSLDAAKVALHVTAHNTKFVCDGEDPNSREIPCSGYRTSWPAFTPVDVYLVASRVNDLVGIAGITCGIEYDEAPGSGVDVFGWTKCADVELLNGGWPQSGGGNRILWNRIDTCQRQVIGDDGVHAVGGAFYVYAYGNDVMSVITNPTQIPELQVVSCTGILSKDVPPSGAGSVGFGDTGNGFNPCQDFGCPETCVELDLGTEVIVVADSLFMSATVRNCSPLALDVDVDCRIVAGDRFAGGEFGVILPGQSRTALIKLEVDEPCSSVAGGPIICVAFGTPLGFPADCASTDRDTTVLTCSNLPPVAVCNSVVAIGDSTTCVAEVTPAEVDNGSFDPDGDPITLSLSPPGPYGLGVTNVTLTVTDDKGASSTCTATITVEDVTPPDVTCPADVTVECSVAGGVPADDPQLAAFFAGFSVVDNCDANPTVINDAPALFDGPCAASGGVTVVTWTATDASGNSAQCSATVTVIDTTQPELSVTLNRDTLWPPNHKMADIHATVEVTDICDPTPTFVLTSVTSDEPDNARGVGDGNTVNDIQGVDLGTDDVEFQLRSERQGGGDGRTYTIVYTATDCSGNATEEEVYVTVPHDQGGSASPAVGFTDDGRNFEPGNSGFTIVVQNSAKTRDVDPSNAYVGNLRGYIAPVAHLWADLNGDSLEELVLWYEMAPALALRFGTTDAEVSGGVVTDLSEGRKKSLDEGLALRYETQSGGYLLGSIFSMGSKIAIQPGNGDEDPLGENRLPQSGFDVPVVEEAVVDVFSVTGRKLRTLIFNGVAEDLGELRWDGKDSSGRQVPNGMYFYRIRSAQTVYTKKIMLVR